MRLLLLEEVAGLHRPADELTAAEPDPPSEHLERLAAARRRAILIIALDWAALLVLLGARVRSGEVFSLGPGEESIFSIGVLAIAVHSGFRLGQLEKLSAVRRVLEELAARARPGAEDSESK